MNKIFTLVLSVLLCMVGSAASAQNVSTPDSLNAYYRLSNPDLNQYMTAFTEGGIGVTSANPSNASQVFRLSTSKLYNISADLADLRSRLDKGEIDTATYNTLSQQVLTLNIWKNGSHPVKEFRTQGADYALFFSRLSDYCDSAITDFLNDEVPDIYNEYHDALTLLAVFSGVIYPADLATEEAFRSWCERYLVQWRDITDFSLYMRPLYITPTDGGDPYFSTSYAVEFKTPAWIGNMKNAQTYINAILTNNGANPDVDTLDIWQSAVERVLAEVAKDYTEESEAYKLAENLFDNTKADMVYALSTDENGDLYAQPLPDAFGTNGVSLTAEQRQRLTWTPEEVNDHSPFSVAPQASLKGDDGYYYTTLNTDFPYRVLSADVSVYTVSAVDSTTGATTLNALSDGRVPAHTPVVVRSKSADLTQNQLTPLDGDLAPIDGNVLSGTLFARQNTNRAQTLTLANGKPAFLEKPETLPANTAFYYAKIAEGLLPIPTTSATKVVFDLQGRRVAQPNHRGIYIINGRKVVVR